MRIRLLVSAPSPPQTLHVGPLEVLPAQRMVRAEGRILPLSVQELTLLVELARRTDRIVQREELFRMAWGREMRPGDRSVDVYVRRLRVKLEQTLPQWRFIHTHFGLGYRLAPQRLPSPDTLSTSGRDDRLGSIRDSSDRQRRRH